MSMMLVCTLGRSKKPRPGSSSEGAESNVQLVRLNSSRIVVSYRLPR